MDLKFWQTALCVAALVLPFGVQARAEPHDRAATGGAQAMPHAEDEPVPPGFDTAGPSFGLDEHGRPPPGARAALHARGIDYRFIYTGEVLRNTAGYLRRGTVYQGKLEGKLGLDFERLVGLPGLHLYANAFQIHGTGRMAHDNVGAINTISNIEAIPTTRLSELWLEQHWLDGRMSLRAGQLTTDSEFFISDTSTVFIDSDWPAITKANLPSGGPAYPLSTPGVRLKLQPLDSLTLLLAAFNGSPAGPTGALEAEQVNRYGTNFRLSDPPLVIGEMQYRYALGAAQLAGKVRLGGWGHFGSFDSLRYDTLGLSLASPVSTGQPWQFHGDSGVYGVIDQQILRFRDSDHGSGIGVFSRVSSSPSDRNLIDFYIDGGIVVSGLDARRPNDKFGATFIYSRISQSARGFDRDALALGVSTLPVRDRELSIELTYLYEITRGWTIQPNLQFISHPGGVNAGGAASRPIVFGGRSVVTF